jgi:laccase
MGGVANKMPSSSELCWLLLGVVLAFGVAASPAQASRANHYDFFVSQLSTYIA